MLGLQYSGARASMVESNNQLDAVAVLVGPSLELYHLIIP